MNYDDYQPCVKYSDYQLEEFNCLSSKYVRSTYLKYIVVACVKHDGSLFSRLQTHDETTKSSHWQTAKC